VRLIDNGFRPGQVLHKKKKNLRQEKMVYAAATPQTRTQGGRKELFICPVPPYC
jgi:hypothetical protein